MIGPGTTSLDRPDRPPESSGPPGAARPEPGIVSPAFSLSVTTGHGDTLQVPVSADVLADLFRSIPDGPEFRWIFDLAARHPAMRVRIAVARHDNLSPESVRRLAEDPCTDVRRHLVSSPAFKRHADTETLLRLSASDPTVAEELAEHLHDFTGCDVDPVEVVLVAHPDPSVRLFLAHNGQASDRTLALLVQDADPGVAAAAQRQAQNRLRNCRDRIEAAG